MHSSSSKPPKGGKVVVCGMKGVGKTSLIEQLIYGNVTTDSDIYPTIEDTYTVMIDTSRGGPGDVLRVYDTAGLQGKEQLPRHYFIIADGYVLVYNPSDPASLDILNDIKTDIDKNKEKKEVPVIVLANVHTSSSEAPKTDDTPQQEVPDPNEAVISRANSWCAREKIKHYTCNAMVRKTLYEPFVDLTIRLYPPQTKGAFPQVMQKVMQKKDRSDA